MKKGVYFLLLALNAFASDQIAPVSWRENFPQAQAASKTSGQPLLAAFEAPWCYSCYYMEQHVLGGGRFAALSRNLTALKLDVDTSEGLDLKEKFAVTFLPTYVVFSSQGKELGRIIGEQTEQDFNDKLEQILKGGAKEDAALAKLQKRASKGDPSALKKLLERPADCQTPYAVMDCAQAVDKLPAQKRRRLLDLEAGRLEDLSARLLFVAEPKRCADFRSGVEALAEVYLKTGKTEPRDSLLDRAVTLMKGIPGQDRNRDDNVRFFLEQKGDEEALRQWYERLLNTYPSDYVYAYRYAKHLHEKGQDAEATPLIEQARKLSYGANRLAVLQLQGEIQAKTGQGASAQ